MRYEGVLSTLYIPVRVGRLIVKIALIIPARHAKIVCASLGGLSTVIPAHAPLE